MRQCMDAENLHRRLKKIIGQIQAIDRMIEEDIPFYQSGGTVCQHALNCSSDELTIRAEAKLLVNDNMR